MASQSLFVLGTIYFLDASGSHPWIVVSDPVINSAEVLIANLTGWNADKDQSCIIEKGAHPCVTKRSCVNYHASMIVRLDDLCDGHKRGQIIIQAPAMPKQTLQRIWKAAASCDRLAPIKRKLLENQGLT